jgi:transmembrane sensor
VSSRPVDAAEAIPPHVLEEAAAWFASLADGSARNEEDRLRWLAWIAADPDHARAWRRVEAVTGQFGPLTGAGKAAHDALDVQPPRGRRNALKLLGALLVAGGAGLAASRLPWREWREEVAVQRADYRTAMGKAITLTLPDGSRVWLGSLSVLDLDFDDSRRRLSLLNGDLLVQTAIDTRLPARPFLVDTPDGRLRALGTRFAVRPGTDGSRVDVFEGAVEITPCEAGQPVHVVHAGANALFDRHGLKSLGQSSPAREAWTRGVLAADRMRLDELVAELARWHPAQIACDPDVAGLQVVGAFPLLDTERVLAALADTLPVRIVRQGGQVRIAADPARQNAALAPAYDTPPSRIP